jgi:murein DD-endopeptidase MepM/ murein hydrolase activator NlpD
MWRGSGRAGRLGGVVFAVCVTVTFSVGVLVGVAPAQTDPPDTPTTTTPPDTTPPDTTPPDTTPPDTTPPDTTPPVTTPPDTTPPDTTPTTTTTTTPSDTDPTTTTTSPDSSTTTTEPDSTSTTTTEPGNEPTRESDDEFKKPPPRDTDIYVGSVSTLSPAQRAAIDAFLAATARLAKAQTARAGLEALSTMNLASPISKPDAERDLEHAAPLRLALLDSAVAANRAVFRIASYAQEAFVTRAAEAMDAAAEAHAQAEVGSAQAELDDAINALRAVANGNPLITALLTGNPPANDTLAQRIAAAQVGQGNPTTLTELFDVPVENAVLASRYGFRIDPLSGNVGFHPGIDISATQGTPIRAAAAGTVLISGNQGGYGNAVVLDHGNSLSTLYGHMVRVAVSPGQHVEADDIIGYVGSTGISTGPHLHFEVRIHGVTVDPLPTFKS